VIEVVVGANRVIEFNSTRLLVEENNARTNTTGEVLRLKAHTSGDMVNSFGGYITFSLEDSASVNENIARMGWERRGNDDDAGSLTFFTTTTAGTLTKSFEINQVQSVSFFKLVQMADQTTLRLGTYTDAQRPSAGTAGLIIFNTDDGQLNIDDGTNWTLPDGTTT